MEESLENRLLFEWWSFLSGIACFEWLQLLIVTLYSLHFRRVLKRKVGNVACWEITFVTITIAQSPKATSSILFVRTARRGRKSLKHDGHVYYYYYYYLWYDSPREFKIIKGIFGNYVRDFLAVTFNLSRSFARKKEMLLIPYLVISRDFYI